MGTTGYLNLHQLRDHRYHQCILTRRKGGMETEGKGGREGRKGGNVKGKKEWEEGGKGGREGGVPVHVNSAG